VVVGDDIAELQEINSLANYIQQYAVRGYDEGKPVPDVERSNWLMRNERSTFDLESLLNSGGRKKEAVESPPDLAFMGDEVLRAICLEAWRDALQARQHGMLKAAVVLIGTVAEGLLLDYLENEDADRVAVAAKSAKVTRPVAEMGLDEMVRVTTALSKFPTANKHLAHFLREHRNTVHPARLRKEQLTLTEADIDIAFAVLHSLAHHLRRP
jgi:hypothetical protein